MKLAINDFLKGNQETAIAKFEKLIQKEPENADVLYNYGCILGELEHYEKEQNLYKKILEKNPNDIETLVNLGVSLNATKNFKESIIYADRAIQIDKKIYQAYEVRGIAKISLANIKGGIEDLKKWLNVHMQDFKNDKLLKFLEDCLDLINLPPIYQNQSEIENTRRRLEKNTNSLLNRLNEINNAELSIHKIGKKVAFKLNQFYLGYQQKNDKDLNEKSIKILRKLLGNQIETKKLYKKENKEKRKIGIISTYQFHPKLFIFDQIAKIDKSKYEIEILIINNRKFTINDYYFEHYTLKAESYDEVVNKIKEKNYKIVLIPDIGMSIVSKILATQKLAEITITTWLHPVTSGSNSVDIFLSGSQMEKDNSQQHYTEKLVNLPGIGLKINPKDYLINYDKQHENNSNQKIIKIGCIQTPFKYHPRMDQIFIELAKAIPNAEFIFIKLQDELDQLLINRIKKSFFKNNLDDKKLKTVERMEKKQYKIFLSELDIAIDTLGWSGGNTTLDLIGAGIPALTMEGEFMRANHTSGIYKLINMNELISKNETDLINAARKLSINKNELITTKKRLIKNFSEIKTDFYISNFINSLVG